MVWKQNWTLILTELYKTDAFRKISKKESGNKSSGVFFNKIIYVS